MRRSVIAAAFAVAIASLSLPSAARTPGAEREIEALEARLREASLRRDVAFFERTLADDFNHTGPSGEAITRAEMLEDYRSGALAYEVLDRDEVKVRVAGDAAIVTERDLMKGSFRNHYFSGRYRVIRVWVRTKGRWQLAASQATFFVEPVDPEGDRSAVPSGSSARTGA